MKGAAHKVLGLAIFLQIFFLAASTLAAEYVSVSKDGASIRSAPQAKAEVLWEVFKDFPLQVVAHKGKWIQTVDFEGDKGWISSSLVSKKKMVIVKAKLGNMRLGPGANYETVARVKYGVVFKPVGKKGDWVKVKHADGTTGWLFKDLIWPAD
ncbi:MAG: SH3 domain-containing protein [Desulfobacteraceae bacterium]|nr:SH3 domain-containing protein [Desulfobacteraceae bacterium]